MRKIVAVSVLISTTALLNGCATTPAQRDSDYSMQREAIAGTHDPVPIASGTTATPATAHSPTAANQAATHLGTGIFINAAAAQDKSGGGNHTGGSITFNFEDQPVQAAVKAILGDVLHANYSIAPAVKGSVTFATAQPVHQAEVLPILEMLLSWTGNAMIKQGNRYLVVPVTQAAAGNLVPSLGAAPPSAGYAARLFPLSFVSAGSMQKLLKPFATPQAFLLVDETRNLLVMSGTPAELANYQRIIQTFDVDWLRGMSVAVIPLQHVQADAMVSQLNEVLQGKSDNKSGHMLDLVRLIPLKESNSLVVITSQPSYINDVRDLAATIDNGASNGSGLYVYNVINVKASDLANHLNELFGNVAGTRDASSSGSVAPGFSPLEQTAPGRLGGVAPSAGGSGGIGADNALGGADEFSTGAVSGATQSRRQRQSGAGSHAFTTSNGIRIAAIDENNQLLVRATPAEWGKLLPVIDRLDQRPLQVQIETKVLQVTLTGQFQFGVQYYLAGLIGTQPGSPPNTDQSFHRHRGAAGFGGAQFNPATDALYYSFAGNDLQFAIKAMENSGDVKILSAPSTVVLNNQETTFKVGEKIPVVQTYLAPGIGVGTQPNTSGYNVGQVQYIDTGVLLDVVPRVNPGGLVYMDIQQIVSKPTTRDQYGNFTIANRALSTEVAVQSGQTVLLGGLIQQSDSKTVTGVPLLDRIPLLGKLFSSTEHDKSRTELIVLITPRVIHDAEDARRIADDYESRFQSLQPILPKATPTSDNSHVSKTPTATTQPSSKKAPTGASKPAQK